jgi:hypothetical protein
MEWLNVTSLLITVLGTGITVWHALKTKRYRDEVVKDRSRMALIDLYSLARHAREECKKLTAAGGGLVRGVNYQRVMTAIQDSLERMQEGVQKLNSPDCEEAISAVTAAAAACKRDQANVAERAERLYAALNLCVTRFAKQLDREL